MDYTDMKTEVRTIQNGVDNVNYSLADSEESVIATFDSLHNIHNDDSDHDDNFKVTKIITFTNNTRGISGDANYNPEINGINNADDEPNVKDWEITSSPEHEDGCYLGATTTDTQTTVNHVAINDLTVSDGIAVSDITQQQDIAMQAEDANRPNSCELPEVQNPSSHHVNPVQYQPDEIVDNISGYYEPPEPVYREIMDADVLITSELRNADDISNDIVGDSEDYELENNEFECPDPPVVNVRTHDTDATGNTEDHQEHESTEYKDGGFVGNVKEKVVEVRNQGLDHAGDTVNDKLHNISDEGLMGKVKGEIVENNVVDTTKAKLTDASDTVINDDTLVDNVTDKIVSSDALGSLGTNLSCSGNGKTPNAVESDLDEPHNAELQPAVLEIDTLNALADDDMDYELQEVDISQSNDDDFGRVFADHRQSMREGNSTTLFHQDASRYVNNSTGTLNNEAKQQSTTKSEKGSSHSVNSMPTDEGGHQKGCVGILKRFFCPKRGSWQPDSYF